MSAGCVGTRFHFGCCSGARLFLIHCCGARLFLVCCPIPSCVISMAVLSFVLPPSATSTSFPPMFIFMLRNRVYVLRALCLLMCCSGARLLLGCCSGVNFLLICCGGARLQLVWCLGARLRLSCCLSGNFILSIICGALKCCCIARFDRGVYRCKALSLGNCIFGAHLRGGCCW